MKNHTQNPVEPQILKIGISAITHLSMPFMKIDLPFLRSRLSGSTLKLRNLLGRLGAVFCLMTLCLTSLASAKEPMNVLFIAVDDLNDWVGVFGGHPQAKTPNMDRLANETGATVFERAYCPASVCGPSRSAILSGIRPSNTGVYGNSQNMKMAPRSQNAETLPEYFSRHGYHTLSKGKIYHKHPGWTGMDEGQWAFDEWEPSGGSTGIDQADLPLNNLPLLGEKVAQKGRKDEFDWGPTVNPVEETKDYLTTAWAADQLKRDFDGKPFFMAVGVSQPHLTWHVPQEFFDMHPLDQVQVPEIHLDDLEDIKTPSGKQKFKASGDFLRVQQADMFKEATQGYLAAVSYADYCIGVLLDRLEKSDHADNTIVVIWGDHGWFLGEKLKYRKTQLWEESTRVPLIVRVPGMTQPASRSQGIVNLIDLYPTLAELCGLPEKAGIDGRSFADLVKAPSIEWSHPTLTTMGFKNHSVRDERYRYSKYSDGTEELYDHRNDPMELSNLIDRPEVKSIVKRLSTYLPQHDEPVSGRYETDKKRYKRALEKIKKMGSEFRDKAERGTLDPEFVKRIYESI